MCPLVEKFSSCLVSSKISQAPPIFQLQATDNSTKVSVNNRVEMIRPPDRSEFSKVPKCRGYVSEQISVDVNCESEKISELGVDEKRLDILLHM